MSATTIKTLLTDIGGVVWVPNPEFWTRLREELSPENPDDIEAIFYGAEGPWVPCRTGELDYPGYMRTVAARLGVDGGRLEALRSEWELCLNAPMVRFLERARDRGLQIVAISNADPMLEARLSVKGVLPLFDAIINSSRVGSAKPDPAIYEAALAVSRGAPSECLFIDDKERNIPPAAEMGIKTALYTHDVAFRESLPDGLRDLYEPPVTVLDWPVDQAGL